MILNESSNQNSNWKWNFENEIVIKTKFLIKIQLRQEILKNEIQFKNEILKTIIENEIGNSPQRRNFEFNLTLIFEI